MKRILSLLLTLTLCMGIFSGCGGTQDGSAKKIQIVTTIFPEYDWVMNILGDNPAKAEVTLLLDKGVDLHSYQPSADDMIKISSCDLFIYVGGESDDWVRDALAEKVNKDMAVINLMDVLGDSIKEEEQKEGMEEDEEHEEHEDEDEPEYDEHVWLSLQNAQKICTRISETLQSLDPDHRQHYKENGENYDKKLQALDEDYQKTINASANKTLLFGDRFPFRYMTEDYGLDYFAAFKGCSAESEASFKTIIFLANKEDELSLPAILTIDGSDQSLARTINDNTKKKDKKILTIDSMQSINADNVKDGVNYLSVMEKNLEVIKEAL